MDNLKYYNDSLAYDFEMFAPKPVSRDNTRDNIVVMPNVAQKNRQKRKAAARSLSPTVSVIMCLVFVLAGLCGNIALRIKINEVNSQITDAKAVVAELDSEKTVLEVELQRRISYINLEVEATELGMKKPSKEDVTYIKVNNENIDKNSNGEILTKQ